MSSSDSGKSLTILERVLREQIEKHRQYAHEYEINDEVEQEIITLTRIAWGDQFDQDRTSARKSLKSALESIADEFEAQDDSKRSNA